MVTPHLDLPLLAEGKVRRLYRFPDQPGRLLMVATDRISAYDHVLTPGVPGKGAILTSMSLWWFDQLADIVDNHLVGLDVPAEVAGRAMVVEELDMFPVECVVRGYLTGSGWAEYQGHRSVCGIRLPDGLQDRSRLEEPIFTPAVKAPQGEHDENIDYLRLVKLVGPEVAAQLRSLSLQIYQRAEEIARKRGIILADTKFEFGRRADGTIVLADEVLTPDSSRFWDAESWQPGKGADSFDKQYVRDWLTKESGWDRASDQEPPALPDEVVKATSRRYEEAWARLTGGQGPEEVSDEQAQNEKRTDGLSEESGEVVPTAADVPGEPESRGADRIGAMSRVVVEVMPKPEILDPQGKAITSVLARLGHDGLTVRQGKRFEITGEGLENRLDEIHQVASELLANTVIESFDVHVED
ncbi:phosphoribosylaminoimidazolesuccinocarboxamide synthase [Propionibacterium sp. NM47_B9-13]|uniref:Multifunctional fusion protein n=2 Tax=Cutibacterium modestum TaxID=2559073 RepID=A0AAD1NVN7_9ACTN|nr:phosphoribosylaminoimidazolesuccinocarboxamide synthase [Cutibacterium modestum]TGY30337.1 phosphoribosylaminoimidazolesuccinocarboxamide synthase [Propionibacterium sp. NM47_B9-13]AOH45937.1 phosphoribosylaminoimidazolesuccinocarboxamide synthase [Cutibacterium modestum]EFS73858.1 phosphoribosylaminoimidazolesuccinocarboxamide synthase [Cutibacterium modestum HL037PA2]EFS91414.1 phosphoribosylaminoimidazolesuccinocarboxamide synthase [Cutibacterium modestum HL044PA1]EFT15520.1 phosphoribos